MVTQRLYQTRQSPPLDVVLLCPPQEVGAKEPVSVCVPRTRASLTPQSVRMRCTDPACAFREKAPSAQDQAASAGSSADIDPDDQHDLLQTMLAEGDDGEPSGSQPEQEDVPPADGTPPLKCAS